MFNNHLWGNKGLICFFPNAYDINTPTRMDLKLPRGCKPACKFPENVKVTGFKNSVLENTSLCLQILIIYYYQHHTIKFTFFLLFLASYRAFLEKQKTNLTASFSNFKGTQPLLLSIIIPSTVQNPF